MSDRRRVLVARLDNAGDVLLAGPAVRAVAAQADVTLLCGPAGEAAARLLPGVAEVLTFDAPWVGYQPVPVDPAAVADFVENVRRRRLDAAVVLTSFHQSPLPLALLLRLAGVPHLSATSVDYPGSLLDVRHAPRPELHEVAEALALAEAAGFRLPVGDDGRLAVELPPGGGPWPARLADRPWVVVHPAASVPARSIPLGLASAAARALTQRGWRVVVTGAADDATAGAQVTPDGPLGVDLCGQLDFADLARVLAGAAAVVCGNTGPAHLAAAVGTPVVSVFAPVVPAHRWHPWGVPHELLGDQQISCAGCRARRCPYEGQPCLGDIGPADVLAAVERLTGERLATERLTVERLATERLTVESAAVERVAGPLPGGGGPDERVGGTVGGLRAPA